MGILPAGTLVASHQLHVYPAAETERLDPSELPYVHVVNRVGRIMIAGPDFGMEISGVTGEITAYAYLGAELIRGGPRPNFWRAPTDNDYGGRWQERLGVWKDAGPTMTIERVDIERLAPYAVEVEAIGSLAADEKATYRLAYTVFGNGDVVVEGSLWSGRAELPRMPRFGMQMELPEELQSAEMVRPGAP